MPAPELTVRRGADRFTTSAQGLVSRPSFAFGQHYDPSNVSFGALIAHNEDVLATDAGYDDHPHRDAEIITWVLSGTLQHVDSYGNAGLVYPGLAQRMSAGAGIVHAERNDGYRVDSRVPAEPVHFVQMWLRPDVPGGPAGYAQREVPFVDLRTDWVPVASGSHPDAAIRVGSAGSTLWATVLSPGVGRVLPEAPYAHLFVARGAVEVEAAGPLVAGDALRVGGPAALRVTARTEAELLVWAMAPLLP